MNGDKEYKDGMDYEPTRKPITLEGNPLAAQRILVTEDDQILRHLLQEVLGAAGAEVTITTSGDEAVRVFDNARRMGKAFDTALVDIKLLGLGGVETLRQVRAMSPDARLVAMSGANLDRYSHELFVTLNVQFLRKPFDLMEVVRVLVPCVQLTGAPN